jgi:hypothetical protein
MDRRRSFRPIGGFFEEAQHFVGVIRKALAKTRLRGLRPPHNWLLPLTAPGRLRDAYRGAAEVARNDIHIERDLLRVKDRTGLATARKYARIIVDSILMYDCSSRDGQNIGCTMVLWDGVNQHNVTLRILARSGRIDW